MDLKEEIFMGKQVLKNPKLCQAACKKYNQIIDKQNEGKFFLTDKIVTDLKENIDMREHNFEVEFKFHDKEKILLPEPKFSTEMY